jgi:signal transduction histidine kinase
VLVHDIKNPITGIQLAVQAVADQLGVESREILQGLEQSLQKLERTMRRTLTFTKPLQPRLQPLVVSRLLDAVARRARPLPVELECAADLPPLQADEALLEEALWNLVQNSFEARTPAGRVRLAARRSGGGELELSVEDDGPGIAASVLPNLFKPFCTTKEHGAGLGLALSRKIVEAHGGEIRADRSALGGARFTLRLRPSS